MPRSDNLGFFWHDIPATRGDKNVIRPRPEVPDTGWRAPVDFPNLAAAHMISVDTETWDPELLESGPGWARGKGHIVGVSIGAKDRSGNIGGWYFPVRHEDTPEDNMDPTKVFSWLRSVLGDNRPKFGANLIYDIGWLREENVKVGGMCYDVQHAEALLSETAQVGLDTLGEKYLGEGKDSNLLYQWCADFYGGKPNDRQRKNIYRAPPSLVGPYAESDATLPLRIIDKQWPLLDRDGLGNLFSLETRLIPLMVEMRRAGVTIDIPFAEQLYEKMGVQRLTMIGELKEIVGFEINVNSRDDLKRAFDTHGLSYPLTANDAASFTAGFLETVKHPIGQKIVEIRQRDKLRNVFIKSYLLDNHVDGKVYCSFNQLRGETYGTRSGRYSSSMPNLQNIPSRTELGKEIRKAFTHDEDHEAWRKYDASQIEYRLLAHFAVGEGADTIRQRYRDDPNVDYHKETGVLITDLTGLYLERTAIKGVNFGSIYGLGKEALAAGLNLPLRKAEEFLKSYHAGLPFVKATIADTQAYVNEHGFIDTILGRRTYFDTWEPQGWGKSNKRPLPYLLAVEEYGPNLRRANTNPALNRRLQGSAADVLKKGMVDCWESGIYDEIGVPRLTVHDELDHSDPGGKDAEFREMKHMLEQAIPLKVPIIYDYEIGANWGAIEEPD